MKKNSRTKNTLYNFLSSIVGQFITILMQFVVRTVFIQTLGKSYLGINGLFTNILSMLSLAELGVGNAILFKLYKPLADKDEKRINILIKFYKKVYTIIGITVAFIGISLIPFLHFIVKDYDKLSALGINAIFIYLIYLLQSVSSYLFFAYKSAIVKADQKEYVLNLVSYIFTITTSIIQIILLKTINNYELYVIVLVVSTILQNTINAHIANKLYPCIKKDTKEKLEKKEIMEIFKDCTAIFLYKLNTLVLTATDNIIISTILGLEMVGMYSNYYILYTTINSIFSKIFTSILHSLGNLHTTKNLNHEYKIFKTVNFIAIILGATAGIGIITISNSLIDTWLGSEWVLKQPFSLLMGIEVYTLVNREYLSKYRNAMGLFQQAKYRPLFGMIINLIASVLLVKYWGICGVLVGTIIADWTTLMWFDPLIIHKYGFENKFSVKKFYLRNINYLMITIALGTILMLLTNNIFINHGWFTVIFHAIVCGIIVPITFTLIYKNNEEFENIKNIFKKFTKKLHLSK